MRLASRLLGAALLAIFLNGQTVFARRGNSGCCSRHGGVASCDSDVGRLVCRDGSYSPSCGCVRRERVVQEPISSKLAQSNKIMGKKEWELIAEAGTAVKFVYISAAGLGDRDYMAEVLGKVRARNGRDRHLEVMFFDSKASTPRRFPMSDEAMRHQRAQYNFNPTNGFEEFVWLKTTDSQSSPPKQDVVKDSIRPK